MPELRRTHFRATVHYDGSAFCGWQSQPDVRTVQSTLEGALERLLGIPTRIQAAGRTDTGVHAAGQEIAFDAPASWEDAELRRALNAVTPDEMWVEQLSQTAADFHPRFDATARRYEYLVGVAADSSSPLRAGRVWPVAREVDTRTLGIATESVMGEKSFEAFAKAGQPERGTRCRVERARWWQTAGGDLAFLIVADRFLHRMVRYLVATLIDVGTGRRSVDQVERLLAGEEGIRPPAPAPACGLYLTGVRYGKDWNRPPGIPGILEGIGEIMDKESNPEKRCRTT